MTMFTKDRRTAMTSRLFQERALLNVQNLDEVSFAVCKMPINPLGMTARLHITVAFAELNRVR